VEELISVKTNPKAAKAEPPKGAPVDAADALTAVANDINSSWRSQVPGIFKTGEKLKKHKDALDHGQFLRLFQKDEHGKRLLDFGEDTAQRLMMIARNEVLSDTAIWRHLSPHWRTIYDIAKLPPALIREMLDDGTIHPELKASELAKAVNDRRMKIVRARIADLVEAVKLLSEAERVAAMAEVADALNTLASNEAKQAA
jgi:hypothetical protein